MPKSIIKKIKEEIDSLEKEMEKLLEEEEFKLSLYKEKEKRVSYLSFLIKDLKKMKNETKVKSISLGKGIGAFLEVQ